MFSPRNGKHRTKGALRMAKHRNSKAYSAIEIAEMKKNYDHEYYEDSKYCKANGLDITAFRVANGRSNPSGFPKRDRKDYFKTVYQKKREASAEEAKKAAVGSVAPFPTDVAPTAVAPTPAVPTPAAPNPTASTPAAATSSPIARSAPTPIQKTPRSVLVGMTPKRRAELQALNQRKLDNIASQRADNKSALGIMEKLSEGITKLSANLNQVENDEQELILAAAEAEIGGKDLLSDFHDTINGPPSPLAAKSPTVASASVPAAAVRVPAAETNNDNGKRKRLFLASLCDRSVEITITMTHIVLSISYIHPWYINLWYIDLRPRYSTGYSTAIFDHDLRSTLDTFIMHLPSIRDRNGKCRGKRHLQRIPTLCSIVSKDEARA